MVQVCDGDIRKLLQDQYAAELQAFLDYDLQRIARARALYGGVAARLGSAGATSSGGGGDPAFSGRGRASRVRLRCGSF